MSTVKEIGDGYILYEVEHYRQRYSWDCGVSCVLMLCEVSLRDQLLQQFRQICDEEGFGHSTWTIDLCYLLKRFGIKHHMYTTMLGVNEDYTKQGYYTNIIPLDKQRVRQRFAEAASNNVQVSESIVSNDTLVRHLRDGGPVLVLVDAGLLVCDLCKHNKLKAEFRRCFGGGYKGHYILLVGHSARSEKFIYRDPALAARLCAVTPANLQRARAAVGTDYDCILVYNNNNLLHTHSAI